MERAKTTGWALAALAAVTLTCGVAWAAQSQTTSIPAGGSFTVTAVVVPGECGAEVCGTSGGLWDEDVRFSARLDAGGVVINGALAGACSTGTPHRVTVTGYKVAGIWYCDTTVVNEAIGAPGTLPPAPLVLAALVLLVLAVLLADALVVLAVEVASVESSLHPKTKANTAAPPSHTHCTVRMTRNLATALARRNPTHQ